MRDKKELTIGEQIRLYRLKEKQSMVSIAKELKVTPQAIKYLEDKGDEMLIIKYLKYLRKEGLDLNILFKASE